MVLMDIHVLVPQCAAANPRVHAAAPQGFRSRVARALEHDTAVRTEQRAALLDPVGKPCAQGWQAIEQRRNLSAPRRRFHPWTIEGNDCLRAVEHDLLGLQLQNLAEAGAGQRHQVHQRRVVGVAPRTSISCGCAASVASTRRPCRTSSKASARSTASAFTASMSSGWSRACASMEIE